ncbi:uncharacterized protein LOC125033644 [Penaeus chinensis]|uniref:uncharacterized protein LOC125033644 n=1 Tax=Penaeus chinensis TaxID=139456 RepID=UPI001FB70641|nr:uncharacterized protein LOC125033644 [Penaeus chinensis]
MPLGRSELRVSFRVTLKMLFFVVLVVMSGYASGYSVVTDKDTGIKIPLPDSNRWSRILLATTTNDTQANITFHVEGYELLTESASPVEPWAWHICDIFQPSDQEEGYVVAPLFSIGYKFTERILQLSLVSNASVTWVLCTDTYTCDLVSLEQEEETEIEEQVEQVEQTGATGVATATNNTVLIAICVILALLSLVLSLYICWTKHRWEKTCQKPQLEKTATSPPAEGNMYIPGPGRGEAPATTSSSNSEHNSENSLYNVITK